MVPFFHFVSDIEGVAWWLKFTDCIVAVQLVELATIAPYKIQNSTLNGHGTKMQF